MKLLKSLLSVLLIGIIVLFYSCNTTPKKFTDETPTRGTIKIACDESYQLLTEAELYAFQSIYKDAKVTPIYASEDSILKLFLADSVRVMVTSRKLTDNEVEYLKGKTINPRTTKIAHDALAFIINKSNPDSLIRYNVLKDIFLGKTSKWNQINPKSKFDDIKVVFDNPGSNNIRTIMDKFGLKNSLPTYCSTATKNSEVINFVESHPGALGIISVNWISDPADTVSHNFLKRFKVVGISLEGDENPGTKFYRPFPGYIAEGSYPYTRDVYCINRQPYSGLAHGFSSFMAGEKGQFIVLHSGLVPAAMPVRLVEIKK